jgi:hypothetical protein
MNMAVSSVELTGAEKKLLARIEFDPLGITGGVEQVNAVCHAAQELTRSLLNRNAIPDHRLRFFADPEYNIGGHGSSRKQILERNANGKDILTSAHFLKYLRYFIYGPSLPDAVIESFGKAVKDCGMVTSGDIIPLGDTAKKLTRKYGLANNEAAEEFYKLALEYGLQEYEARSIRDRVKKSR